MTPDEELIAETLIGEEARKFVESDLGKTVLGMADQEIRSAQEALESVNPTDVAAIEKLQQQAKFGRSFNAWLSELITRGEQALQAYKQQQKGEQS